MNNSLRLNKLFYTYDILVKSKRDYADYADIEIEDNKEYFLCKFINCRYDTRETMLEFENYLIEVIHCGAHINDMD